jgi:hypothetical protein
MTVRRPLSASMNERNGRDCQSTSRWLTHQAGNTSGGPSPVTAYAMRAPGDGAEGDPLLHMKTLRVVDQSGVW